MKESTKRNTSLILTILFFLAAIVVFFNNTWPALMKIVELNEQLNLAKEDYAKQAKSVQLAKDIINQYKNLSNVNQMVSLALPKNDELYNALAQLDVISQNSGLLIQNISLPTSDSGAQKTSSKSEEFIKKPQTIVANLNLVGNYESFKTWLNAIETNIRLMDITTITFSGVIPTEKATTTNLFAYRVSLNFYYQP